MKEIDISNLYEKAIKFHKDKNYIIAQKKYEEILNIDPNHINTLNNLGIILFTNKKINDAINLFKKVISIDNKNIDGLNNLGLALFNIKNFVEAESCFKQILKKNNKIMSTYNNLAIVLKEQGKYNESIDILKKAIKIDPINFNLYNNLGTIFMSIKEYQKAIFFFKKSIELKSDYVDSINNIGIAYFNLKNLSQSLKFFEKSLTINPNNPKSLYNMANVLKEKFDFKEAISLYEKAIKIEPLFSDAYNNLALAHIQLKNFDDAIDILKKSLGYKKTTENLNNLLSVYVYLGDYSKAINLFDEIETQKKDNLVTQFLSMNIFPIIYESTDQIEIFRKRFIFFIKKIDNIIDKKKEINQTEIINALKSSTNFYLSYQGKNDLNLQIQYSNLIKKLLKKTDLKKKFSINGLIKKKIKIAFISEFFYDHTITRLFKNWIKKLDNNIYEKNICYIGSKIDNVTKELMEATANFHIENDLISLVDLLKKKELNVIFFLDIGMHPKIQILASLRLAKIQISTWGHPITSGSDEIDYFLSSEFMETKYSKKYYKERLISIPGIGIDYGVNIKNINKLDFKKNNKLTYYLNHQSLFKLLPEDDNIYIDIIKKNPDSKIWFIKGASQFVTDVFQNRLKKLFNKNNLSFENHIHFFQKCPRESFLGIINEADVILDSINWSGGNSNLEAISLNKPIVTFPSNFLRGRHTYAMLKIMNINETIALSKKNYVDIAVSLGKDKKFRKKIINQIKTSKDKIFSDKSSVNFIDNFIRKKFNC